MQSHSPTLPSKTTYRPWNPYIESLFLSSEASLKSQSNDGSTKRVYSDIQKVYLHEKEYKASSRENRNPIRRRIFPPQHRIGKFIGQWIICSSHKNVF